MEYFDKTYHPLGTPPGTLVANEDVMPEELKITLVNYTTDNYVETELSDIDECRSYLNAESTTWIHFQGQVLAKTIEVTGQIFKLHSLALEDVLNTGQRPKVEEYSDQLFVIMSMPHKINKTIDVEQVSIFLGHDFILSFHSGPIDPFVLLRTRLRNKNGRIRNQKADYLLYCILDMVIDRGYPVLEGVGEDIENIEEVLINSTAEQSTLRSIHVLRRELLLLRRSLWPQREVLNRLLRDDSRLIREGSLVYLRDCYDHTIQILEIIENYRDMMASMVDIYLSSVSHRLNEIMRVLTMIATIFIPLTFVVGLYGMNFSHADSPWAMPELHLYYGYPIVLSVMIIIATGMILYFKRKGWF